MRKTDRLRAQLRKLDDRITKLTLQRVNVEEEFAESIAADANRCPQTPAMATVLGDLLVEVQNAEDAGYRVANRSTHEQARAILRACEETTL